MDATTVPPPPSTHDVVDTGDRRLTTLRELVDSGRYDVLSLDVFDTFVWRRVPRPSDAFFVLAARLAERGALWPGCPPESFVQERIGAESRARRHSPGQECTLAAIWDEFPAGFLANVSRSEARAMELALEHELVVPDPGMRALAEHARARGLRVAFVSDTYFTSAEVRSLARWTPDVLLASCEHGRSKPSGLHAVLLQQLGVEAARVLHVGDHAIADAEAPGRLGLDRFWLRAWPEAHDDALNIELPESLTPRAPLVAHGDEGVTALRRRAMFACVDEYERWGAGVLGPLLASFADWVRARCRATGAAHVLCLMREGRMLKRLIDASADDGPRTHECFVSRHVARRAAVIEASEEELAAFFLRPSPPARSRVLAEVGLVNADLGYADDAPLGPRAAGELARRIARDAALAARVRRTCAEVRAGLVAHLRTLVPDGTRGPVAVVDLGYAGTIQSCLERIVHHERLGWSTHGLYVVTGAQAHVAQETGAPCEGWLASNGQPVALAHTFLRSPEVVEQSLMADCGTTRGHAPDGTPDLAEPRVPAEQRSAIDAIQRGLLRWARLWRVFGPADRDAAADHLRGYHRAVLARSVARPSALELELFGDWQHDENFGSDRVRALTDPVDLHEWEQAHLSPHQLASLPSARLYWPCGFAHRTSPEMGEAVAAIFQRAVRPEVFHAAAGRRPIAFYWDEGAGFEAASARIETVAMGPAGRAWHRVRLDLRHATHHAWGLTLGVAGEVVELTGVRVHVRPSSGGSTVIDLDASSLRCEGMQDLGAGLYRVERDPSLVVVPAAGVTDFTGEVWVDLFFGRRG